MPNHSWPLRREQLVPRLVVAAAALLLALPSASHADVLVPYDVQLTGGNAQTAPPLIGKLAAFGAAFPNGSWVATPALCVVAVLAPSYNDCDNPNVVMVVGKTFSFAALSPSCDVGNQTASVLSGLALQDVNATTRAILFVDYVDRPLFALNSSTAPTAALANISVALVPRYFYEALLPLGDGCLTTASGFFTELVGTPGVYDYNSTISSPTTASTRSPTVSITPTTSAGPILQVPREALVCAILATASLSF